MPFAQLVASLLGLGIAGAKSKRELDAKMRSPEVQQGMREYHYLYDPVPTRKGYCRVMEFDLIHKRIREDNEASKYYRKEEYHLCRTADILWNKEWRDLVRRCGSNSRIRASYHHVPSAEIAADIKWWDWVKKHHPDYPEMYPLSEEKEKEAQACGIRWARERWFEETFPEYRECDGKRYTYQEFALEYARKTVYESGYIPSCQTIGGIPYRQYTTLYDGRLYGFGTWGRSDPQIDWTNGIPDQNERKLVIEIDQKYPYRW